jgi:hypothetical protein
LKVLPICRQSVSTRGIKTWKTEAVYNGRHSLRKPTQLSKTALLLGELRPARMHLSNAGGGGCIIMRLSARDNLGLLVASKCAIRFS